MKFQLLNVDSNAKTVKGQARGFMTGVLYLSPSDTSGVQLCPMAALAACEAGCLNTAGRGGMSPGNAQFTTDSGAVLPDNTVQRARLRRTAMFNNQRDAFMHRLYDEVCALVRKAERKGLVPVVRLNGTSDIRWEDIPCLTAQHIFALFPEVQFYDYTKIPNRRRALGIPNYHLTFSYSHAPAYAPVVVKALQTYGNAVNYAAVFAGALPDYFLGRAVINGDESDLRFADETGVVVGLTAKGRAKRDTGGFVVRA
jgi:hypothetical protein